MENRSGTESGATFSDQLLPVSPTPCGNRPIVTAPGRISRQSCLLDSIGCRPLGFAPFLCELSLPRLEISCDGVDLPLRIFQFTLRLIEWLAVGPAVLP